MLPLTVPSTTVGNVEFLRDIWITLKQRLTWEGCKWLLTRQLELGSKFHFCLREIRIKQKLNKGLLYDVSVDSEGCNSLSFPARMFVGHSFFSSENELMQLWKLSRPEPRTSWRAAFLWYPSPCSSSFVKENELFTYFLREGCFLVWCVYYPFEHSASDPQWNP